MQIWDLKTYKLKTDLPGHADEVYCVDFVADKVVSGGRDRTVKMYVYWRRIFRNSRTLEANLTFRLDGGIKKGC